MANNGTFHDNFQDLSELLPENNRLVFDAKLEDREWPEVTDRKKRLFLQAFRNVGTVRLACEQAHISRSTYDKWIAGDANFVAAKEQAHNDYYDLAEAKLAHMALRRDNIAAISIMLQMARRYEYGKQRIEHTGKDGGPIQLQAVSYKEMILDKINTARARLETAGFNPELPAPEPQQQSVDGEFVERENSNG